MGASASVKSVYKDATMWFRQYFDDDTYVGDFNSIDKNHDGSIHYKEFLVWLQRKEAEEGGSWKFFISHPEIVAIAHLQAGKHIKTNPITHKVEKIVDIADFKALLIQLFAVSIFWAHFKKADDWQINFNSEAFNGRLSEAEFTMAVKSFCAAYGQERVSDEQIKADFKALDTNDTNDVSLLEVCTVCAQFIDPEFGGRLTDAQQVEAEAFLLSTNSAKIGATEHALAAADEIVHLVPVYVHNELQEKSSEALRRQSTNQAMDSVLEEVKKNSNIAELVEMKMATEKLLAEEGIEGLDSL